MDRFFRYDKSCAKFAPSALCRPPVYEREGARSGCARVMNRVMRRGKGGPSAGRIETCRNVCTGSASGMVKTASKTGATSTGV